MTPTYNKKVSVILGSLAFVGALTASGKEAHTSRQSARLIAASSLPSEQTDLVVTVKSEAPIGNVEELLHRFGPYLNGLTNKQIKLLLSVAKDGQHEQMFTISGLSQEETMILRQGLQAQPWVTLVAKNRIYRQDPLDIESISSTAQQDTNLGWHHERIGTQEAWSYARGQSMVVAVTDDGLDYRHPDLLESVHYSSTESGKRSSNGVDDDHNGYIDDFRGWNFADQGSNDPFPNQFSNGSIDGHGTHVSGIIAGRNNRGIGTPGVAPDTKIMPLRLASSRESTLFSSARIAEAYGYAIRQGVKIINTSYRIDRFAESEDPIFKKAIEMVYDAGAIIVASAGNSGRNNPARQVYDEIIFVASTARQSDYRFPSSNYGKGIDIAAPGDRILSTLPDGAYGERTGTSMSSPIVAGVIALTWSKHPEWTRDQVIAQVLGTAVNIDEENPNHIGLLGSGRVSAINAVRDQLKPPTLDLSIGDLSVTSKTLTVTLNHVYDPTSVHNQAFELRQIDTGDEVPIELLTQYKVGTNQLEFAIADDLTVGRYQFIAKASLRDPFGQPLDGNQDGFSGDDYEILVDLDFVDELDPKLISFSGPTGVLKIGDRVRYIVEVSDDVSGVTEASVLLSSGQWGLELTAVTAEPILDGVVIIEGILSDSSVRVAEEVYISRLTLKDGSGKRRDYQKRFGGYVFLNTKIEVPVFQLIE
ncbi:MAG: S8 family serine peptidase [Pseudobacteriovorax sp.]|nr:S8 family serine peptidase [Pseudobacteriovorax sp.]